MFLGQAVARHQVAAGHGGRHVHLLSVRAQLGLREPDDVVGPALLFCAPAGGFVTGQVLYIDGGVTASQ
jgi:NAD(P)-dependent dehydrogenase (short-subunit alcohol dehydrogenase family)